LNGAAVELCLSFCFSIEDHCWICVIECPENMNCQIRIKETYSGETDETDRHFGKKKLLKNLLLRKRFPHGALNIIC